MSISSETPKSSTSNPTFDHEVGDTYYAERLNKCPEEPTRLGKEMRGRHAS